MIKIRQTPRDLFNLIFILAVLGGISTSVFMNLLRHWSAHRGFETHVLIATVLIIGMMLGQCYINIRSYRAISQIESISIEGIHLVNGKTYRFEEAQSILFKGSTAFRIKFRDGWLFQPVFIEYKITKEIIRLIKQYIEKSPNRSELIAAINSDLKKEHNSSSNIILVLSVILIGLGVFSSMSSDRPLLLILLGLISLFYGLYKRLWQRPKNFEDFT